MVERLLQMERRSALVARLLAGVLVAGSCGAALAEPPAAAKASVLSEPGYPPDAPAIEVATAAMAGKAAARPDAATICGLIAANADAAGMPRDFFARLIWKESRFDVGAISPVGAQGIAQFMPYTARERGLANPFDLVEAIRHSALYLKDLKAELGNWGLAAAAYNGGINRVKGWLADGGSLPSETEDYVQSITARPADWFREAGREIEERPLDETLDFMESCAKLPVMKTRAIFAAVESAPMQPWGVQVAGHFNQSVAMKMFRRIQSTYPSILGGREPIVIRDRNGRARKAIYAVRLGADTRAEANGLCGKLRSAGGNCVVMKN